MIKKIMSVLCIVSLLFGVTALPISADAQLLHCNDNIKTAGYAQTFDFSNAVFAVEKVKVNNNEIPVNKYIINDENKKLFIYPSVFSHSGSYEITVSDSTGDNFLSCTINLTELSDVEYTFSSSNASKGDNFVNYGSSVGTEHSANGVNPIAIRNVRNYNFEDTWFKWNVIHSGQYKISYSVAKTNVGVPVAVEVKDMNGTHIFKNLATTQTSRQDIILSLNGEEKVFSFAGTGDEYIKVTVDEEQTKNNIIVIDRCLLLPQGGEFYNKTISVSSELYEVEDDKINGILYGADNEEILSNIKISSDCIYYISNNVLRVEKIYDTSIYKEFVLNIGKYISAQEYVQDDDNKTINEIPYGESIENFIKNILHSTVVSIKIMDSEGEIISGPVISGYRMMIYFENDLVDTYTLNVVPASDQNIITSNVYTIAENVVSNVPFNTIVRDFLNNITLPFGAKAELPYDNYDSNVIANGIEFKIVAQNGAERLYSISVNSGNSNAVLSSSVYTVDNDKYSVAGVRKGDDISDFLNNISASNGGKISIFDKNMNEIKAGEFEGGETVRVYPEDCEPGNEYFVYTMPLTEEKRVVSEHVLYPDAVLNTNGSVELNTTNGKWFPSSAYLGPDNSKSYYHSGSGTPSVKYTPEIEDGTYTVYVYILNLDGGSFKANVYNNGQAVGSSNINITTSNHGWYEIGTYDLTSGNYVQLDGFSGSVRISAVRWATTQVLEITSVNINEDIILDDTELYSGVPAEINSIQLNFDFEAIGDSVNKDNIKIITQNGYSVDYELNGNILTPLYDFEKGMYYYVYISDAIKATGGYSISKPYMYAFKIMDNSLNAKYSVTFVNSDDIVTSNPAGMCSAAFNVKIKNNTQEEIPAALVVAIYENNCMVDVNVEKVTIQSGLNEKSYNREVSLNGGNVKTKVLLLDTNNKSIVYIK